MKKTSPLTREASFFCGKESLIFHKAITTGDSRLLKCVVNLKFTL